MSETDKPSSPEDNEAELRRLFDTALYDTGSYVDDSGYWERSIFHADLAVTELARRLAGHPLSGAAILALEEAIATPGASLTAQERLLAGLKESSAPLISILLSDPDPERRAMAVRLARSILAPSLWLPMLDDPHPLVRCNALQTLIEAHCEHRDSAYTAHAYPALVRRALGDADADVRQAAAASTTRYLDRERNMLLAGLIEREADPAQRRSLTISLIRAGELPDGLHDQTVRAALLRGLHDSDNGVRRFSINILVYRVLDAPVDEELTDVCIALFERLLVEREYDLIQRLAASTSHRRITSYVIARLTGLLPDGLPTHFGLPYFLRQFGMAGVPLLQQLETQPGYISVQAQMSLDAIAAALGGANSVNDRECT